MQTDMIADIVCCNDEINHGVGLIVIVDCY